MNALTTKDECSEGASGEREREKDEANVRQYVGGERGRARVLKSPIVCLTTELRIEQVIWTGSLLLLGIRAEPWLLRAMDG